MKALSDPTHPINLANKEFGCSGYPICSLVCFFIGKANYNILLVIEFEFEFEFTNSFLLFYSNMMIKRPSTLCDAQSINRSANPNDNKWCTVMHFRLWPNEGIPCLCIQVWPSMCTSVIPVISYLSIRLTGCSVGLKINHGARKLTQTP